MTLDDIKVGDLIYRVYGNSRIVRRVERKIHDRVWVRLVPEESALVAGVDPSDVVVGSAFLQDYSLYLRTNYTYVSSLDYMTNEELDDDDKKIIHSALQERISEREIIGSSIGLQANQVRGESVPTTVWGFDRELGIITAGILPPIPRDEQSLSSQRLREQALDTARNEAIERAMSQLHNLEGGGRAADSERQDYRSTYIIDWPQRARHRHR